MEWAVGIYTLFAIFATVVNLCQGADSEDAAVCRRAVEDIERPVTAKR